LHSTISPVLAHKIEFECADEHSVVLVAERPIALQIIVGVAYIGSSSAVATAFILSQMGKALNRKLSPGLASIAMHRAGANTSSS